MNKNAFKKNKIRFLHAIHAFFLITYLFFSVCVCVLNKARKQCVCGLRKYLCVLCVFVYSPKGFKIRLPPSDDWMEGSVRTVIQQAAFHIQIFDTK